MPTNKPQENIDILELLRLGTHYTEKVGDKIHVVNVKTGETYIMYAASTAKVPQKLELVILEDGTKVWTQEALVASTRHTRSLEFSPVIIDLMCQEVLDGKGISEICKIPGMPTYTLLCRWRREHPWVEDALARARKDRGEVFRDKAVKEADLATSNKDPLGASNLRVETYKWAAAVDEPERYSPRSKVEAQVSAPTQIIIHTGIDRTPDARVVTDITKEPKND